MINFCSKFWSRNVSRFDQLLQPQNDQHTGTFRSKGHQWSKGHFEKKWNWRIYRSTYDKLDMLFDGTVFTRWVSDVLAPKYWMVRFLLRKIYMEKLWFSKKTSLSNKTKDKNSSIWAFIGTHMHVETSKTLHLHFILLLSKI